MWREWGFELLFWNRDVFSCFCLDWYMINLIFVYCSVNYSVCEARATIDLNLNLKDLNLNL